MPDQPITQCQPYMIMKNNMRKFWKITFKKRGQFIEPLKKMTIIFFSIAIMLDDILLSIMGKKKHFSKIAYF